MAQPRTRFRFAQDTGLVVRQRPRASHWGGTPYVGGANPVQDSICLRPSEKQFSDGLFAVCGRLDQIALFQLAFEVGVVHGGNDDAADAEHALEYDHGHQQFPRARFDFRADDFGV